MEASLAGGRLTRSGSETSMAYDEGLAQRIRESLHDRRDVVEKRMFGGLAFMVRKHMCCGIVKDDLMVRVGADRYEEALRHPHARPMDFTRKPLKGFVYVGPRGTADDVDLEHWIGNALRFVLSLPAKT